MTGLVGWDGMGWDGWMDGRNFTIIYIYIFVGINNIALLSALDGIWNKETPSP